MGIDGGTCNEHESARTMSIRRPLVLVTGLSGLICGAVLKHMGDAYELRGLNRRPVPCVICHQSDIADLEVIAPAFTGVQTVVHLAATVGADAPFADLLHHNIAGTYNVFEAARRAGVPRIVFASSGNTVTAYELEMPYRALVTGRYDEVSDDRGWIQPIAARPGSLYGCSKLWGETLGRHYADVHGMSVLCLRIGNVNSADRPLHVRDFAVWCSQRDAAQAIERAINAPASVRYEVVFVTSENQWGYRDLTRTRAVLGFAPRDRAEDYR